MSFRIVGVLGLLVTLSIVGPRGVEAQQPRPVTQQPQKLSGKASQQKVTDADRSSPLVIKISASRPRSTAGAGLGVIAELQNMSDSLTLYLLEKHTVLVLPPEMRSPASETLTGMTAFFPTEYSAGEPDGRSNVFIVLRPGDSYSIFWATVENTQSTPGLWSLLRSVGARITSELYFIFFPPGDYTITVEAKYWSERPGATNIDTYRTVTQSAIIPVAAPDFVILFGASVGGIMAYFIFPEARRRIASASATAGRYVRMSREVLGIFGAVLLSTIVTILLSRVAETQFLIRVTVNDIWGAIAIGFVANYGGSKLLDRLLQPSQPRSVARVVAPHVDEQPKDVEQKPERIGPEAGA